MNSKFAHRKHSLHVLHTQHSHSSSPNFPLNILFSSPICSAFYSHLPSLPQDTTRYHKVPYVTVSPPIFTLQRGILSVRIILRCGSLGKGNSRQPSDRLHGSVFQTTQSKATSFGRLKGLVTITALPALTQFSLQDPATCPHPHILNDLPPPTEGTLQA